MKVQSLIEDVLIATGITVSLIDIQQMLSIILLVFNVLWILWKFGYRIYQHFTNKQFDKIESDIKDAKDEIEKLTNQTKDSKGEK